jgi:hypothetical protein
MVCVRSNSIYLCNIHRGSRTDGCSRGHDLYFASSSNKLSYIHKSIPMPEQLAMRIYRKCGGNILSNYCAWTMLSYILLPVQSVGKISSDTLCNERSDPGNVLDTVIFWKHYLIAEQRIWKGILPNKTNELLTKYYKLYALKCLFLKLFIRPRRTAEGDFLEWHNLT